MLETLDYTIRIGSTPTVLYFDLYLYSAYAEHYVYVVYVLVQPWLCDNTQVHHGARSQQRRQLVELCELRARV